MNFQKNMKEDTTMDQPSHLCSEDFWPDNFQSQFLGIPGTSFVGQQSLKNDAIPTIQKKKRRRTARANFFEHHQRPTLHRYTVNGLLFLTQSTQKCLFIIVLCVGCKGPFKTECKNAFWAVNFPSAFHQRRNRPCVCLQIVHGIGQLTTLY